jgi:hypothetical protein
MAAKKTAKKGGHKRGASKKGVTSMVCYERSGGHKKSSHGSRKKGHKKGHRKSKRNDAMMLGGDSTGMRWLKFFGSAIVGIGVGVIATLLLARTAYEAQTQDIMLGVGGLVLGSLAMQMGVPVLGASVFVGAATIAVSRAAVRMSASAMRQSVIDRAREIAAQASGSSAPAPTASAPTTAPGGYPSAWNQLPSGGGNLGQQWSAASVSLQPVASGLG